MGNTEQLLFCAEMSLMQDALCVKETSRNLGTGYEVARDVYHSTLVANLMKSSHSLRV